MTGKVYVHVREERDSLDGCPFCGNRECTLEAVSLQAQHDSTLCCLDCEPSEEGDGK